MMKYYYNISLLPDPRCLCLCVAVLVLLVQGKLCRKGGPHAALTVCLVLREKLETNQVLCGGSFYLFEQKHISY